MSAAAAPAHRWLRPGLAAAPVLVAPVLVALVLVLGASPADASPASPRSPRGLAEVAQPAPSQCTWVVDEIDGDSIMYVLHCPDGVDEPDDKTSLPTLPAPDCRLVEVRNFPWITTTWVPQCPSDGMKLVHCRDENSFWWDDEREVPVPVNAPQWWLDEIEAESGVDEGKGCSLAENPPTAMCADIDLATYEAPGLLPDQCWGTYPTANYELSWEDGAWYDLGQYNTRLMGWLTSLFFLIGRSAMQVTLWLVDWAHTFDIKRYTDMAARIGAQYDVHIVDRWYLTDVCWLALAAYFGVTALRSRLGRAGGEVLVSFVVAGLAFVLFANRAFYMDFAADTMRLASDDLLLAARGDDSAPPDDGRPVGNPDPESPALQEARRREVIRPLQNVLHSEFVERPYVQLNWGVELTDERCLEVLNNITATGWDEHGWPARYMERSECPGAAEIARFNRDVGGTRMFSAVLVMIMAVMVGLVLGFSAATVVIAKFLLGVLFTMVAFVTVAAVLPGHGRRVVWIWLGAVAQVFIVAIGMSFLLSLLLLGVTEVLEVTQSADPIERWAVILVIVAVVFFTRKRLLTGSQAFATSLTDGLTRLSPATAQWSGSAPVGFDFDRTDRMAGGALGRAAWGATYGAGLAAIAGPALMAGGLHRRMVENRVRRKSLRNLEIMERRREMPIMEGRLDAYTYSNVPDDGVGGGGGGGGGRRRRAGPDGTVPDPRNGHWRNRGELRAQTRTPIRGNLRHPFQGRSHRRHNRRVARAYDRQRTRALRAMSMPIHFRGQLGRHREPRRD